MSGAESPEPTITLELVGESARISIQVDLVQDSCQSINRNDDVAIQLKLLDHVCNGTSDHTSHCRSPPFFGRY
ncbi:hypothetical protein EV643_13232 [Kribbella sp. VKM Ac-2527]|uniref:Uncharacterized protein n=1 Tax=Kribbella caucasensis TaxID=2512215 RepID=A0A4R6JDN8_9ACTN|nr:hypothetical protein EV643_13232 [Kribbella sp. VKM Ac-2527]